MNQPPNFNRLARIYRWMEWLSFGPWLGWCRCAFLPQLSAYRRAVVLGDGDGRFTARLLASNPLIQIDAVDASSAMLEALTRRAGRHCPRVRFHLCDAREWQPAEQAYDLIATHFFLDCLTTDEVESLAVNLRRVSAPRAFWLVSEFAVPPGLLGRLVAKSLVSALYWAFSWLTGLTVRALPDHAAALRRSGFDLQCRRIWLGGLLISEVWCPTETQLPVNPTPVQL
jgi:ubiquinone/menaquinone biosynthesis C-methylase UbiE